MEDSHSDYFNHLRYQCPYLNSTFQETTDGMFTKCKKKKQKKKNNSEEQSIQLLYFMAYPTLLFSISFNDKKFYLTPR